jgi:hypothetical protein
MKKCLVLGLMIFLTAALGPSLFGQAKKPNKVVFAVINNGGMLEPLAKVENGKLMQTVSGGDDSAILSAFHKTYYAPKKAYSLIFGGAKAGTATVKKSDPSADCSAAMAQVTVASTKVKLNGFVMALATDIANSKPTSGLRRKPTVAERADIEKLVVAEFGKNKVSARGMNYHNLTALDLNNDKATEFVGSYWVNTSAAERGLLFFIAAKDRTGKYSMGHHEFRTIKKDEVMSGDIKNVDEGIYHELLLDVLDFDDNGVAEVFTMVQGFEGNTFNVYEWKAGKFTKILEASSYHCGY